MESCGKGRMKNIMYMKRYMECRGKLNNPKDFLFNFFIFFLISFLLSAEYIHTVAIKTGNGFIEGTELDGFLREFVASANPTEVNSEVSHFFIHTLLTLLSLFAGDKKKTKFSTRVASRI